jgi:hypothetical protein
MTEAEWLTCTDPFRMLEFLRRTQSGRKARLFICGLCRFLWRHLVDKRSRKAVEIAERYADGMASRVELQLASRALPYYRYGRASATVTSVVGDNPWGGASEIVQLIKFAQETYIGRTWSQPLIGEAPKLLRCVFANPFRVVRSNATWLAWNDSTIPRIAQTIYDDLAFDGMPILADALEDAGCDDADILRHCREPGEHVRGCWVIDLLLGKE